MFFILVVLWCFCDLLALYLPLIPDLVIMSVSLQQTHGCEKSGSETVHTAVEIDNKMV